MKLKMKGKKLILLIALLALIATIAILGFSSKEISFISAITKSNKDLQYYDENTVFVLFTKYLDENQSVIAPTSVQTQTVDKLDYKIDIPQIDGYTPLVDELEGILDQEGMEYLESLEYVKVVKKDNIYNIYITITYDAAPSAYSVVYYEQNTDLNGYTEINREVIGGTSGNYTGEIYTGDEVSITPEEKTGFVLNLEKTKLNGKVEAFGKKEFGIYYDRKPYYLYTYNTGDSYYEPITIRYGQNINLTEEPTYSGYVFDGWKYSTSMNGEKIDKPSTMPAYNIYAEAQWIKSDTHYTLSYYTQNPDDDGYTNIGTIEVDAVSGDNLKDKDQTTLKSTIEKGFKTVRGNTSEYYYYNEEKTKTENNDFDIVVQGKGVTVVPIYFDRQVYNITLDFDDEDCSTRAEVTMGDTTYTDSYTFQARYEQNLLEHWITANDFTVFPKVSGRTYYFKGWQASGSSTTYVSLRLTLTSTMIEDADSEGNITYYAQYSTSSTSRELIYLFESFDQTSAASGDSRRKYSGKYYDEASEYRQTVYTSSSMTAKEITGVENVGQQSSSGKYYFYYDRNVLKITLYNMNNVHIEKELLYGQSMEEFVDTQLNPEDFSLETPGTKDWIFEGWYQDSNFKIPMVWEEDDGSYKTITDNLVLYAKWSAPTYTVTFNTNGGTWTETDPRYIKVDDNTYTLTVEEGESLIRPANPTKMGNVASAWNYDVNSENVEYLFSDSQKVYSDLTLDLQYTANKNIPYKVRYIEAQYKDGVLIEDVSQYTDIVDLAPSKEVYDNTFGTTVYELPLDIYDNNNEDNYFVVNMRSEELTLTSENIDDNVIYFLYAKNPIVPYTVYYVKNQEDESGNQIRYDYGDIPADDVLLGKKETTVAAGYATEIAEDIDGWTINGSYSQTIKLTLKPSQNTMYFYYNENETGEYLVNFFFMNSEGEYSQTPDYTYESQEAAGKILYGKDFDKFTYENGPTESDYEGKYYDTAKCQDAYLIVTTTDEISAMDLYFANRTDLEYTVKYQDEEGNDLLESKTHGNQMYSSVVTENAPSIEGYKLTDGKTQKSITIGVNTNEIVFTYAKRNDLTYTVNYYVEGTTTSVIDSKKVTDQVYSSVVTENAPDIEGYTKVDPTTQNITIGVNENVINFYYNIRTDLSYTVKYLEKGTNTELATAKTVNGQTYNTTVSEKAIDIYGYDKTNAEEKITIKVSGNEIIFYYTKRVDLSYTVKYLEDGTDTKLAEEKVVTGQTYKSTVKEEAIEISGYDKVDPTEKSITVDVSGNEIVFYYTKRTDLSYTVKYLEQGTNAELAIAKTVNGQTYKSGVTEDAIEISGYDKVAPTEKSITIEVSGNEIVFYYTKRTDLSYTVKYLEKDTNVELASTKTVDRQTYKSSVTEEAIEISGYDKADPTEKTITIEVSGNEIVFYYTKRTDLSYTVKYLEDGTNTKLAEEKVVTGQTYKSSVTEDAIEISGYDKVDPTEKAITIEVSGNEIVFYYTKRTDLSYTVKYLEDGTNTKLAEEKVVTDQTYKSRVTEEAIEISGYDKVDPTEKAITIEVSGNEIIFYYAKRTDLSYTVKYLEQGTNTELATVKTVKNQTYKSQITEKAIEISGYDKVNPTEKAITIEVSGNEIVFYYTKRTDLSYTVKYLEKDTNVELVSTKTVNGQTYKSSVTEEAIEISGYDKVDPTEKSITIEVSGNEIVFYYTKRTDLSYTVKYLEQETDAKLAEEKIVTDQTYKAEVKENAIDISGYDKVEPTEKAITLEVSGNEIIFYYTKRTDLSYTVKYLEDGTNTKIAEEKIVNNQTYKSQVTEKAIEISGYDKVEPTSKSITVEVSGNEIVFYYTKRTDLSYTVKYLEQGTNTKLAEEKVVTDQTYKSSVTEEAIEILGYDKVNQKETITVEVSGSEIVFYYTKRTDLSYTVKYLEDGTNEKLAEEKVVTDQTYKSSVTEDAIEISGYNKVDPTEKSITIEVSGNEMVFYYTKRVDLSYTVKYLEKETNAELATAKTVDGQTYKSSVTEDAIEISGYNKVDPTEKSITIEVSGNEIVFYYTKRTDLSYTVKYLEKETNAELATAKTVNGQTYKSEVTEEAIEISGYDKVDPTEKSIIVEVSGNEMVFYYTKRTDLSYTVKYLEKETNAELATIKTLDGQTYKSSVTEEAIEISGYDKVAPTEKTITIEVSGNEIVFYYTKRTDLSYTVKYLEQGTDKVLANEKNIENKTFKEKITENAINIVGYTKINPTESIVIEVSGNEIIFYYKKVDGLSYTVNYLEQGTNINVAPSKVIDGKTFEEVVTENAIDVEGYDKEDPTEKTITIGVGDNIISFYYTKRTDLEYTVKYLEQDTDKELAQSKVVTDQLFKLEVTETAIDIEGYDKVDPTEKSITIEVSGNEIVFYYTKRTDLSYTVKYLEQDTNTELLSEKVVGGQTFKSTVKETAVEISGYDKVDPTEKSITIEVTGNEIVFYYTKRTDLSYTVKYLEEDSNEVLATEKVVNDQTYKSSVTEEAIEISGYDKVDPTEKSITIEVSGNEIVFYYTKRTDLSYTVKYLEEDSNEVLAAEKVVNGQTYKSSVTEEAIEISGYDKVDPTEKSITVEVSGNEIVFYYTKRIDLSYTVKYLEEDSNEVLAAEKVVNSQTYKSSVTEEAIEISGYDKVDPTSKTITVEVSGNEIVFYYTKRTDLSYTVKYLEQETGRVLSEEKVVDGLTYKSEVTENSIDIVGFTKVNTQEKITIEVSGNEIIFYYKKVEGLAYTVNYLEQGTNKVVAPSKNIDGKTFEEKVTEKAIDIEGYDKVNPAEVSIEIGVGENIINFYYTKRVDLSYTVKYLEQGSNIELSLTKTVDGKTFEEQITENARDIEGYDKVGDTEKTITMAVSGNEIIFYYTKRTDLSYTVKYLEQDSNEVLLAEKVVTGRTFQETITEQSVDIAGYNKVNLEESITIEVSGNEITFYYTKKSDIEYTVEFYYEGVLDSSKTEIHQATFKQVIDSYTDNNKVGYKLDEEKNFPLQISANSEENVIQIYYVIDDEQTKEIKYTVEYYKEGTLIDIDTQVNTKTVQILESEVLDVNKDDINIVDKYFGYRLDSTEPTIIPDQVNNGDVIKVYYVIDEANTKTLNYTVEYYKEGVLVENDTQTVSETVQILQPDTLDVRKGEINTVNKYIGYKLKEINPEVIPDKITTGETIKVYYVIDENQRKDLSYTIEYYKDGELQKDETKEVSINVQLLQPDTIPVNKTEMVLSGKYVGYKLEKTSPAEIPTIANNGDVIRIYYIKDQFNYTVEYYYDGNIDSTKTDIFTATYDDVIKEYTDKNIFGYRLEKTENLPLKVSEKPEENVIKVYYIIDDGNTKTLNYTVEYYMDGVLQEGDTQLEYKTVQVLQPDTFEVDKSKINLVDKYVGYKLDKTEPNSIPDVATTGEVYKVYYVRDTFGYTVEYYYEGQLNPERTENLSALYDTMIDTYPNKDEGKYDVDYTENFPMKISENSNNNIIKVHYEKKLSTITVHYYLENINNGGEENKNRTLGEHIENGAAGRNGRFSVSQDVIIKDKVDTVHKIAAATDVAEKYELIAKPEKEEITMTVEPQEFEYTYRLKEAKVIVNFINQITGEILATQVIKGQVDDMYHAVPKDMPGFGFKHDEIPENEIGKMTIEPITVNFYYQPSPQGEPPATTTTTGEKTNFKGKGPATGDSVIIVSIAIVIAIIAININQGKVLKINTKEKVNGGRRTRKSKLVRKERGSKKPSKIARMERVSRLEKNCKKSATKRVRKH